MNRQSVRLRLSGQDGYTAIEMIITMALTAIVSGTIFSSFLVLDRIQTAWEQREQARVVGVLAEAPLLRDVQAYRVKMTGPTMDKVVLESVPTQGQPFQVTYLTQSSPGGSVLSRTVSGNPSVAMTVAHGVRKLEAKCVGNTLTVRMWLDTISTITRTTPVQPEINPALQLTPRNGGCP